MVVVDTMMITIVEGTLITKDRDLETTQEPDLWEGLVKPPDPEAVTTTDRPP
jgi:hypothetical protein